MVTFSFELHAALPEIPDSTEKAQLWKTRRLATIQALTDEPSKTIPGLLEMLVQLKSLGYRSCSERDEVTNTLESTLLAIPGHAKYYQEKIDKMRDELLENSKKTQEDIIKMQNEGQTVLDEPNYLSDVGVAIRTLRFMPSAETVSVLGYFLNDPVLRDGKTLLGNRLIPGDYTGHVSNAQLATEVIRQLGIEQPPFGDIKGKITPEEIDTWKNWWNEIKDGRRTYRFIGSNIEYGPDGPANREAIQRNDLNRKRDDERDGGHKRAAPATETAVVENPTSKGFPIAGVIAACVLLAGAGWYFLSTRNSP